MCVSVCVCVRPNRLDVVSVSQQLLEGGGQVGVVGVLWGCVQAQDLQQGHVLLDPPGRTQEQLLQAAGRNSSST